MEANTIFQYLAQYGTLFIFIIIFLEYLNVPGLAAAIIMPLVGVWCAKSEINLLFAIFISAIAGLAASWILYFLGLFFGDVIVNKYLNKYPKQKEYINKKIDYIRDKGNTGVFISRFIPAVRTLISVPAGLVKLNLTKFTVYSFIAIAIYNSIFISAGYLLGNSVFKYMG